MQLVKFTESRCLRLTFKSTVPSYLQSGVTNDRCIAIMVSLSQLILIEFSVLTQGCMVAQRWGTSLQLIQCYTFICVCNFLKLFQDLRVSEAAGHIQPRRPPVAHPVLDCKHHPGKKIRYCIQYQASPPQTCHSCVTFVFIQCTVCLTNQLYLLCPPLCLLCASIQT